jgi:predicted nucleic acid-binding protein
MVVFVDTSALYALMSQRDLNHERAMAQWKQWLKSSVDFTTSNYVIVEASFLIQNRLGMQALKEFNAVALPLMDVYWISEEMHKRAMQILLAANRRRLSLVDCSSFAVMRQLGLNTVFAFDQHFAEQGFTMLPDSR